MKDVARFRRLAIAFFALPLFCVFLCLGCESDKPKIEFATQQVTVIATQKFAYSSGGQGFRTLIETKDKRRYWIDGWWGQKGDIFRRPVPMPVQDAGGPPGPNREDATPKCPKCKTKMVPTDIVKPIHARGTAVIFQCLKCYQPPKDLGFRVPKLKAKGPE